MWTEEESFTELSKFYESASQCETKVQKMPDR